MTSQALIIVVDGCAGVERLRDVGIREIRTAHLADGCRLAGRRRPGAVLLNVPRGAHWISAVTTLTRVTAGAPVLVFLADYDAMEAKRYLAAGALLCVERRGVADLALLVNAALVPQRRDPLRAVRAPLASRRRFH